MRFIQVVLSGAALVSAALAVEFNSWPSTVKPGQKVELTYSPKDNTPTTIILRKGASGDLDTLETITTSATGGTFTWTVPSNLANGADYAFEIRQAGATPNYSGQWSLTGSSASPSSASASASSSASSSASETESSSATSGYSTASITSAASTTVVTSASVSISSSAGLNTTVSTRGPSPTTSGRSSASSTVSGPPENTGAASALGSSPIALFMGAAAALAYFL